MSDRPMVYKWSGGVVSGRLMVYEWSAGVESYSKWSADGLKVIGRRRE